MTEAELRAHLEADPPAGHGMSGSTADGMSMTAMTERHDAMHASGAEHQHGDMATRSEDATPVESDATVTVDGERTAPAEEPGPPESNDATVLAPAPDVVATLPVGEIEVRSLDAREIGALIAPWDTVVDTPIGLESFARGSFAHVDPKTIALKLGHDGPVVGRGISIEERAEGAYMGFRVSKTPNGDEALTLAADGATPFVSIEYSPRGTKGEVANRAGKRTNVLTRVDLKAVATTYKPYYQSAAVTYVRSEEGVTPVTETQEVPANGTVLTEDRLNAAIAQIEERSEKFSDLLAKFAERDRKDIEIPTGQPTKPSISKGEWVQTVVRLMTGERIPELQMRALDDVITTDNAGVVPPAYLTELIGVIDASRPFLSTTRRLEIPSTGMKLTVPVITQRPTAAKQTTEKQEVSSQKTVISTEDFNAITIAGAGDLSIQLIKRSSPSFLNLWMELLAEAYAIESEDQAILALLNAIGGVGAATALDPENLKLGDAYISSFDAIRRPPDTIWLSTEAVGAFIDAKASTTNQPMYPGLRASATAAGGVEGVVSGLRPVHVPSLDAHGAYAIVGPSSGFAWAEDGTYTLQVDVPATAGRDVALVGILWPAPWYPAAFTAYNVAS
jgi:HK97 family phage major capsid protein